MRFRNFPFAGPHLGGPTLACVVAGVKVVITSYHAFKARDLSDAGRRTKAVLAHGGPSGLIETPAQVVRRVCRELGNKKNIVGGFIEFRSRTCGLIRSTDGGVTWKILDSQPDLKSYPYCLANNSNIFHAPVAFGRNGTLYLATHAWDTPDSRNPVKRR